MRRIAGLVVSMLAISTASDAQEREIVSESTTRTSSQAAGNPRDPTSPPLPISYSLKFDRTSNAISMAEDQVRDVIRIALGNNRLVPTEIRAETQPSTIETPYISINIELMDEGRYVLEVSCFIGRDRRGRVSREPVTSQTSRAFTRGPMAFGIQLRQAVVEQANFCVGPLGR